jgi:hypothetical protein
VTGTAISVAEVAPGVVRVGAAKTPTAGPIHARIAVICGSPRAGRLVAKLLADALDRDHRAGAAVSDAGSIVGTPAWTTAVDSADRFVLAVDAVGTGPAEAASLLDQVARAGQGIQIDNAVTVVLLPPARRGLSRGHEDVGAIREHFQRRTRAVLFAPNDHRLTTASQAAWRRIVLELRRDLAARPR